MQNAALAASMEGKELKGHARRAEIPQLQTRVRLGEKGRIVIPAPMREALGITESDMLDLSVVDGELRIASRRERLRRAQEWARQAIPQGVSLADELSAERREAARHE